MPLPFSKISLKLIMWIFEPRTTPLYTYLLQIKTLKINNIYFNNKYWLLHSKYQNISSQHHRSHISTWYYLKTNSRRNDINLQSIQILKFVNKKKRKKSNIWKFFRCYMSNNFYIISNYVWNEKESLGTFPYSS